MTVYNGVDNSWIIKRGRWARGINRKLRREVLKQQNLLSPAHLLPHRNKIPNNAVHDERIQQTGKACIVRKQKLQEAEKEKRKKKGYERYFRGNAFKF